MYPTNEQIDMPNQFLGSSRFIYNYYLSYQMNAYKENKKLISIGDLKKIF